jgi:hypothetical protein
MTVQIAHAEPRPGRLANGESQIRGHLVVLADDAGHRAVPIWMQGDPADDLSHLLELAGRPADQVIAAGVPQELTTRLLGAARARVTGVEIDVTDAGAAELSPEVTVARIGLAGPAGTRQVTADLGLGLALAAGAGVPVRLADAVMDRLAVPVPGDDLLTPFLDRVPSFARARLGHGLPGWPMATLPGRRPRYEPRNLDFAAGLDHWVLGGSFTENAVQAHWQDYAAAADHGTAVLSAAVPQPGGFAWLAQEIFADDYHGAAVTFRGQFRTSDTTARAGLFLRVMERHDDLHGPFTAQAALADPASQVVTLEGPGDWTAHEVTAPIRDDANTVAFGLFLAGPGQIELRDPELAQDGPALLAT